MRFPVLLRTRVARRILGLFLLCAMLPVATVVLLSYRHVAGQLKLDAQERLRGESKTAGMLVLVRIEMLTNQLEHVADRIFARGESPGAVSGLPRAAQGFPTEFQAISVERAAGQLESLRGELNRVPSLSNAQVRHLEAGLPVLVTAANPGGPRIYLVLRRSGVRGDYPRVWGVVSLDQVVGGDSEEGLAPPETQLCLLESGGGSLDCVDAEAASALRSRSVASGGIHWRNRDRSFFMGYWDVFLNRGFAASAWTLGLSVPESAALAPLAAFRRTFLLGLALAALLVFTLSHIQLRKGMTPLVELESGTRRLREGDFSTPVVVKSNDEFESLADSFNRMAGDLQQQFSTLTLLHAIDRAALETQSAQAIAEAALTGAPGPLRADEVTVAVALANEPGRWNVYSSQSNGTRTRTSEALPDATELAELAANPGHFVVAPAEALRSYFGSVAECAPAGRVVFPILDHGRPRGALVIVPQLGEGFTEPAMVLGRRLSDQLAVALSNVSLVGELDALSLGALTALAHTVDAVSPWTAGHSERVSRTAVEIGGRLGLDREALDRLRRGSLLHDIGKIAIPAAILDKPGPLTEAELAIIQSHPALGSKILAPIAAFADLIPLVHSHHELLDGSGYPQHLRGQQIPLLVRILTVADVFDALVSDRPYRHGLHIEAALKLLQEGQGRFFDSGAVRALEAAVHGGWGRMERVAESTGAGRYRKPGGALAALAVSDVEVY